jgi:regulator of protease activity HflC (stomatin/prohibitin superfamily)
MEALAGLFGFGFILFIFVGIPLLLSGIRIINQYERGIVFTLGKFSSLRNPDL